MSLVTHSRGGLVGDLLCLREFDAHIVEYGAKPLDPSQASSDAEEQRELAYAEHRTALSKLAAVVKAKAFVVERYVRVAAPARGTQLAASRRS